MAQSLKLLGPRRRLGSVAWRNRKSLLPLQRCATSGISVEGRRHFRFRSHCASGPRAGRERQQQSPRPVSLLTLSPRRSPFYLHFPFFPSLCSLPPPCALFFYFSARDSRQKQRSWRRFSHRLRLFCREGSSLLAGRRAPSRGKMLSAWTELTHLAGAAAQRAAQPNL